MELWNSISDAHAIVAKSSLKLHLLDDMEIPRHRRGDGVEVHEGPCNKFQDNLTHCLISTQT